MKEEAAEEGFPSSRWENGDDHAAGGCGIRPKQGVCSTAHQTVLIDIFYGVFIPDFGGYIGKRQLFCVRISDFLEVAFTVTEAAGMVKL